MSISWHERGNFVLSRWDGGGYGKSDYRRACRGTDGRSNYPPMALMSGESLTSGAAVRRNG
mgnify:CR=1 FL=1